MMTTKTCQCGEITGLRCESDDTDLLSITYIPPYLLATVVAAGTDRGLRETVEVCWECAQILRDYWQELAPLPADLDDDD